MECLECGSEIEKEGQCPKCIAKQLPLEEEKKPEIEEAVLPQKELEIEEGNRTCIDSMKNEPDKEGSTLKEGPETEKVVCLLESEKKKNDKVEPEKKVTSGDESADQTKPKIEQEIKAKKVEHLNSPISGDINYNYYQDPLFTDPTKSLPEIFSQIVTFKSSREITDNISKLKEKRLTLLVCLNDDVLRSMAYTIIKEPEFDGYERRILGFDGANAERDDLYLDMFISDKIGSGEKMVVIVEIEAQRGFFDSIFGRTLSIQCTQEILREKNIMLVCMVNSIIMEKVTQEKQSDFLFHKWEIDFLSYLLELSFPGSLELDPIRAEILKQRSCDMWDTNRNDSDFHRLISRYILKGKEVFEDEVKKRSNFMASGKSPREFRDTINKKRVDELFIDKEPHKTVLYAAAFYNELTPTDFEQIVLLLLDGKKILVDTESQVLAENGEVKTIKKKKEKDLIEVWGEESDKILNDCHLKAVRADDFSQFIDFSSPYLKNEIKKHIEEQYPMYLRHQFEHVQDSAIAFLPHISPRITENIIRLSVDMSLINPTYYGAEWFVNFIIKLNNHFKVDYKPTDNVFEEIIQFIVNHENHEIKIQFYARLSNLIREMLNHSQLQEVINSFLNRLIEMRYHEELLEIVLQVGKRLRFAPHFDLLYWLRRLLDQGYEEIQDRTYRSLLKLAVESKFQIYELLEKIMAWLPQQEGDNKKYSPSNQYALLFVLDYCLNTANESKFEVCGEWPSKYPLFYPIQKDQSLTEKRLKDIIVWLLHPGIQVIFDRKFPGNNFSAINSLAYLVEVWSIILLGKDIRNSHKEALAVFDILVHQLFIKSDIKQRKEILKYWGLQSSFCSTEISGLSIKEKELREKLASRYKILAKLITQFKQKLNSSTIKEE
jgi:hypothetical protein